MTRTGHMAAAAPEKPAARSGDHVTLTPELMDAFLEDLRRKGRTKETLKTYDRNLALLYNGLPQDKQVGRDTLENWRTALLADGYAVRTVNTCVSAANSLMEYCGHREFQVQSALRLRTGVQPELTRAEYLRLLSAARALGKERSYLLVKVFGSMGLNLQELPGLTAQAVRSGRMVLAGNRLTPIPGCLREELLDYAVRTGITAGPLFVTRAGKPLGRTNVTKAIQALCADAQVECEKGNPRCLKKLYQSTRAGIQANLAMLMEQTYDRILETEQLSIGWTCSREVSGF